MRKRRTTVKRKTHAAPARTRKRVTRRKKGMLSELFNPNMAQAAGKVVVSGALGGVAAGFLNKVLPDTMAPKTKAFYQLGAGFLTASVAKMPNLGAGMAGVGMYNLLTVSGYLAEDSGSWDYADEIESLPVVLNENGAMYLQDNAMYLQEGNGMYLQEDFNPYSYDVGYYGAGFGLDNTTF
jgi:hypothetical protein